MDIDYAKRMLRLSIDRRRKDCTKNCNEVEDDECCRNCGMCLVVNIDGKSE